MSYTSSMLGNIALDLVLTLRLAYLGAASVVLLVYLIPVLHDRLLSYGPRASSPATTLSTAREKAAKERPDVAPFTILLDRLADIKVPHSWFTSFYAVSVGCSLFWASQIVTGGPAYSAVVYLAADRSISMTWRQVIVAWAMMLVQGSRRLYECMAISKPSSSQMWFGHWVLGIFFYIGMGIAVWIEGIPALQQHTFSFSDVAIAAPSLRNFISILIFIFASGFQHDCHAYLASLRSRSKAVKSNDFGESDYKLPEHAAFSSLIAPHYTAECLIYLSLAMFAAPQGAWLNWTVTCALGFVAVNLGVTADGSKVWYEKKFGRKAVEGKARMIPFMW